MRLAKTSKDLIRVVIVALFTLKLTVMVVTKRHVIVYNSGHGFGSI